jgi:mono/diheme cytochrome c family protein
VLVARCGVILVAALLLAGCGGGGKGDERRSAVNDYIDRVNRAEAGLAGSSGQIDQAFRNFRLTGNGANEVEQLTFARDRVGTALARVRAITPPHEARRLHADVVQVLALQHAAAAELLHLVTYQPQFRRAIRPLTAAGKSLASDIGSAAKLDKGPTRPTTDEATGAVVWSKAGCGTCHTLTAAGSTGTSGPNLDPLQLSPAEVAAKVRAGGGGMPAFAKRIAPKNIDQLAAFVSAAEAHEAANSATLDAYAAAFDGYRDAAAAVLASLRRLDAPPVLEPSRQAELRTVGRAAQLSGVVATSLRKRDVAAANAAIRRLFASAAAADQAGTRNAAAAAVRAYNGRLRRIATLSARITRERQQLVAEVG